MLLLLMGRSGLFAFLSVVINALLFIIAIEIDLKQNGQHIMLLFSVLAIIFTFISLLLVLGFSKGCWRLLRQQLLEHLLPWE